MANDKEIRVRAVLDDTGFDQKVRGIQQKLQQMNRMQQTAATAQTQYGAGSKMSGLSSAFFGDFNKESIGNLREAFNLNTRKLQHEEREMKKKQKEMRELQKIDEKMTEGQKDRLKFLKDEIDLIKQKGRVMVEENNKMFQQAQAMGGSGAGFKGVGGPPQGPPGAPPGFFQRAGRFGRNVLAGMGGGSALGGLAAAGIGAANLGSQFMGYQMQRDTKMLGDIGSQTQSANIDFQHMMQNRGFMNQFERPERQGAMEIAMARESARRMRDPLKAAASIGGSALGYGAAGAAIGSIVPGLGTGIGAAAGGIFGAGKAMLDPANYRQIFDRDAYNAEVRADTLQNFRGNMTAMRMQDPGKFAAGQMFSQRMPGMQGMQRALGMEDRELFGQASGTATARKSTQPMKELGAGNYKTEWNSETGQYEFVETEQSVALRQKKLDADRKVGFMERSQMDRSGRMSFSQQRIQQNIQQMLGAGGTSEMAGQGMGAQIAAEYQRAGFTGAAGQMGSISGARTPAGQVEGQYKKMVAEAMRIGLDDSALADNTIKANESSRRILGAFVKMYQQTAGAEGAVAELSKGIVGGGGAELAGAMQSFARRNQEAGQGGGYRGALKWAYLNSAQGREDFGGVSEDMKAWATTANIKNLDEDSPMVRRLAEEMGGIDPADALKRIRGLQRSGENYAADTEKARKSMTAKYGDFLRKNKKRDSGEQRRAFMKSSEGMKSTTDYLMKYYRERGDEAGQESAAAQESTIFGGMDELGKDVKAKDLDLKLGAGVAGAADTEEASRAADQAAQLDVLNKHLPSLVKSAEENASASIQVRTNTFRAAESLDALMTYMKEGGDLGNKDIAERFQQMLGIGKVNDSQPKTGNRKNKD